MTVDELDRILGSDEPLEPSSGLSESVMDAVREEARTPEPLAFPWRRVVPGLVACLALLVTGIAIVMLRGPEPGTPFASEVVELIVGSPLAGPITWAAGSLLLSWAVVRLSLRLDR
jgi:hypothetical protein